MYAIAVKLFPNLFSQQFYFSSLDCILHFANTCDQRELAEFGRNLSMRILSQIIERLYEVGCQLK